MRCPPCNRNCREGRSCPYCHPNAHAAVWAVIVLVALAVGWGVM